MYRFAFLTLILWSSAAMALSDRIEQTYAAADNGQLIVDVKDGHVDIEATDANEVAIEVIREAKGISSGQERELLERHRVEISQEGNTVRIKARMEGNNWNLGVQRFSAHYRIRVPRDFDIDTQTSDGNIDQRGVEGRLKLRTSDGDVKLAGLRGDTDAQTSDGNIEFIDGYGETTLKTSDGNIRIAGFKGAASTRTSDGNITVVDHEGQLDARTSDGSIDITFASQPADGGLISTSDGNITLRLQEGTAVDLDCRVTDGHIDSDFAILGQIKRNVLRGQVNGGGPALKLRTSDGNINLKKI